MLYHKLTIGIQTNVYVYLPKDYVQQTHWVDCNVPLLTYDLKIRVVVRKENTYSQYVDGDLSKQQFSTEKCFCDWRSNAKKRVMNSHNLFNMHILGVVLISLWYICDLLFLLFSLSRRKFTVGVCENWKFKTLERFLEIVLHW